MAGTRKRRPASARQVEADRTNLQKARQAHPKGHQTGKQLAAERKNLIAARKAHSKGSLTGSQLAADRANLVKARAAEKTHPSAKMLAAEQKWKLKGEAAWRAAGKRRAHRAHLVHQHTLLKSLKASQRAPLGSKLFRQPLRHSIKAPTLLGEPRKFAKRISPTGSPGTTTAWRRARAHHFKRRVHIRKVRHVNVRGWRGSRKRIRPR